MTTEISVMYGSEKVNDTQMTIISRLHFRPFTEGKQLYLLMMVMY